MKCPHCGRSCILPTNTLINLESFHTPRNTITECCGQIVRAVPVSGYRVETITVPPTVDDWNRPAKRIR